MEVYRVREIKNQIRTGGFTVKVPGSKSITNRAMLLAMLADGRCRLSGALFSDDSRYLQKCIADLGFEISADEEKEEIEVRGLGGDLPGKEASVYVGSAGTAARFLTALLGIREGEWHLDSSEQMKRRPMQPLIDSLTELGAKVSFEGETGHFPFTIHAEKSQGGDSVTRSIAVNIDRSSQFLSALLIAAGGGGQNLDIRAEGSHGMAYIDMTVRMMEQFGGTVKPVKSIASDREQLVYQIRPESRYAHQEYEIEPDVSAASYFYAMAAILGIEGMVRGVHFDSLQGDVEFLHILEQMGCRLWETAEGICLQGPAGGKLKGIHADMHSCSDQAITLAAIAPYADSPVTITGIGHIRYQESDRIHAVVTELQRMGIQCEEGQDFVRIYPGSPKPAMIETYDDHRMAMGFSLTGLRAEGIEIKDPGCCRKTFENYFGVLDEVIDSIC